MSFFFEIINFYAKWDDVRSKSSLIFSQTPKVKSIFKFKFKNDNVNLADFYNWDYSDQIDLRLVIHANRWIRETFWLLNIDQIEDARLMF